MGSYIHYYCDSGYERVGDFSRKCQVGATWTGSTPTCEKSKLRHEIICKEFFHATILVYTQPFDESDEMSLYNVTYILVYNCPCPFEPYYMQNVLLLLK